MAVNLDAIAPTFKEDLSKSHKAVKCVADWAKNLGFVDISLPEDESSKVEQDYFKRRRERTQDPGDLWVDGMLWEIKWLGYDFSPGGREIKHWKGMIIDPVESMARKKIEPTLYMHLSKSLTVAAVNFVRSTKHAWYTKIPKDNRIGRARRCYYCPLNLLEYYTL